MPVSNNKRHSDHQATVRNMPSGGIDPVAPTQRTVQRELSDEYEDYDDQYLDAYSSHSQILQEGRGQTPLEDELPDTTILDSVILPAIASVSDILILQHLACCHDALHYSCSLVYQPRKLVWLSALFSAPSLKPSASYRELLWNL